MYSQVVIFYPVLVMGHVATILKRSYLALAIHIGSANIVNSGVRAMNLIPLAVLATDNAIQVPTRLHANVAVPGKVKIVLVRQPIRVLVTVHAFQMHHVRVLIIQKERLKYTLQARIVNDVQNTGTENNVICTVTQRRNTCPIPTPLVSELDVMVMEPVP